MFLFWNNVGTQDRNIVSSLQPSHISNMASRIIKIDIIFPRNAAGELKHVLAVCARLTQIWAPIDMSGHFSALVSAKPPLNISPNPLEVICKVSEPKENF